MPECTGNDDDCLANWLTNSADTIACSSVYVVLARKPSILLVRHVEGEHLIRWKSDERLYLAGHIFGMMEAGEECKRREESARQTYADKKL